MDFAPVNEQICRQRTLLPSTNTKNITGYEFRDVFTIAQICDIMLCEKYGLSRNEENV